MGRESKLPSLGLLGYICEVFNCDQRVKSQKERGEMSQCGMT